MRVRSSIMSVAAAGALAVGLCLGTTAAASAATATRVDISQFFLYTGTYESGSLWGGDCFRAEWAVHARVASVVNHCEYRLYLQENKNGHGGWSYCINPHSTKNYIGKKYRKPRSVKVANSTRKC